MSTEKIIEIVEAETGITLSGMKRNKPTTALFARYVAIVMLDEEGIETASIAKLFGMDRTNAYYSLKTIDGLLKTNKQFKKMYLDCIRRMAEMEGAA